MWKNFLDWQQWLIFAGSVLAAVGVALLVHYLLIRCARSLARRTTSEADELLIQHLRRPVRWLLIVFAVYLATEAFQFPGGLGNFVRQAFGIASIAVVAWLLIRVTSALSAIVLLRFQIDVKDNRRARGVHTQMDVLRRLLTVAIIVVALASILMTFPRVHQLGATLLASAGIAGIILGLAAQKTLGNLIAGLQIVFTQPLRIDDVVIVEGEWGRIEEITLTYVVVRIWDLRRLIVPITYFIEKPFQNWTRVSADLLAAVSLYVDYTVPVEAVRAELSRILAGSDLWDRKVNVLQVTNATDRVVEVRALMSAANSGAAWDLRCLVREKLIEFLRAQYPRALPRTRAELEKSESRDGDAAPEEPGRVRTAGPGRAVRRRKN
jgi:small-conductance mechanosensitive channel